ncbi:MAG: hypothetical protein H7235_11645 [Bdellovibrionaceae bacterium]|nr:hypothetical protein [Pseudobdellovibrionaceae bacterium]
MNNYVVWLDSKDAHIFSLKTTGIEKTHLKKSESDHHRTPKSDMHKDKNAEPYYHHLAERLKDADQVLLMGPGLAKTHFKDYLDSHEANTLAKKIIGIETVEKMTENQIMASARKFFKHYDLFNSPI